MRTKTSTDFLIEDLLAPAEETIKRMRLPPNFPINDLTQVRDSTDDDEIGELMEGILEKGQLNDGLIAALLPHETAKYVATWNEITHADHRIESLMPCKLSGQRHYLVRVAGHRRGLAVKRLNEEGRSSPKFDGKYGAAVHFGLTAQEAIELQIQENLYRPPHPNEEARRVWDYYCFRKDKDPTLTLKKFSRKFGHSEEWVRRAARFCGLPSSLQMLARGGKGMAKVPYGILVEAGKHQEVLKKLKKPIGEHDLARLVFEALAKKTSTRDFAKQLASRIEHIKNGATEEGLFDTMQEERQSLRHLVDPHLEAGSRTFFAFSQHVELFFGPGGPLEKASEADLRSYAVGTSAAITAEAMEKLLHWTPRLREFYARRNDGKALPVAEIAEAEAALSLFDILVQRTPIGVAAE